MLKSRKYKKNRYQGSRRDRFKGNFRPFQGIFLLFAWFSFVAALGAGLSQLYFRIVDGQWFKLEKIEVTGTKRLSRTDVLDAMGLRRGECALGIDVERVANRLKRLPMVASASVELDLRGRLAASVVERKPVAVVSCGGRDMLMDSEGVLFAQTGPGQKNTLPLMTGLCDNGVKTGEPVSADSLQHIMDLLSAIAESKNWLSSSAIDECRWTKTGLTLIMGQRAVPVNFGKDGFKQKLAILRNVIRTLGDRGWSDLVTQIDLDYPGRAYLDGEFPVPSTGQGAAKRPG